MLNSLKLGVFLVLTCLAIYPLQGQLQTGENIAVTNTTSGKVRGYIQNGIFTYKGIPYAEAKRFEAPQKAKPWTGVRSSMTYGPVAPLLTPTNVTGDEIEFFFNHSWGFSGEDCMRINVDANSKHGGARTEKKLPLKKEVGCCE